MFHVSLSLGFMIFLALIVVWMIGLPHCKQAFLIAKASTEDDVEKLARYLASKACKEKTCVESVWQMFIPAAHKLVDDYNTKRRDILDIQHNLFTQH